ncbi:histidinol dehydrogenase [Magnetofaba australis]|uniref:Histidinol dehydrogenase n=1 Tax=Magnetofaba australis IT-1 TaxID=1434232 RepID=A0A1Y2K5A5_9PROT|nr:histidinol dehydrogenase [Magnetofaba australis]OSM04184.1 putative histidinol dehydrogenase [Magnetofaba australis IT-1]
MADLAITRLNSQDADFDARFAQLVTWDAGDMAQIEKTVADIIADVRAHGDAAVADYTQRFDKIDVHALGLEFTEADIDAAIAEVPPAELEALKEAAERIRAYHQWQLPQLGNHEFRDAAGAMLGQRVAPLQRAGLYVPGGRASYPSSVLMNAIPAKVAGVEELIMAVPTPNGEVNPLILAAARIAGVDRAFRMGGAQAVAAMAYGTQSVPGVDKIVGPGNIYVAMAKRQVFGQVGIDMIAGPSEILVVADNQNDPRWIAADLLSQAEHDPDAQSILITDDADFADRVEAAIEAHLLSLSRTEICLQSLNERGGVIIVPDLEEGARIASRVAPEHLELAVADPRALLPLIRNAGAIFLGRYTPEAVGDYVAGPNHVLPTNGTARFSNPLGVHDFITRTSLIDCSPEALRCIGPGASVLAASEGLTAHQLSVDLRLREAD